MSGRTSYTACYASQSQHEYTRSNGSLSRANIIYCCSNMYEPNCCCQLMPACQWSTCNEVWAGWVLVCNMHCSSAVNQNCQPRFKQAYEYVYRSTNLISMNEGIAGTSTLEPCATLTALVDANRARRPPFVVAPTSTFVRSDFPRATGAVDSVRHCFCGTTNSRGLDCNARTGDTCHSTARCIARGSQIYGGLILARRFGNSLRLASIVPQVLKAVALQASSKPETGYSTAFTPSRIWAFFAVSGSFLLSLIHI